MAARFPIENMLNAAQIHPHGLSPQAIVIIRKLQDPRPGTLRLSKTEMRPPWVWEEAVTASIDRLARGAARPALGHVPDDAEAVLFLDRSELLTCLARDWSQGKTVQWWWKSLFRNPVTAGVLMHELLETPEYCPAVLRILAEQGKAASVVAKLSRNEAVAILRAITQKFWLGKVQAALEGQLINKEKGRAESTDDREKDEPVLSSGTERTTNLNEESGAQNDTSDLNSERRSAGRKPISPPWLRFVPESAAPLLGPEQQALIGIGLMLTRAPAEIRKKSFAVAIGHWKAADSSLSEKRQSESKTGSKELNSRSEPSACRHSGLDPESSDFSTEPLDSRFRWNDERTSLTTVRLREHELGKEESVEERKTFSLVESDSAIPDIQSPRQPEGAVETAPPVLQNELVIETELGGFFYLINLGLYLGLYGDFTTPRTPGIDLDIWDFVTLLGRELMNDAVPNDPVWPLLATFAGRREGEAPGTGFDPPDEWRLPPAWLKAFPEEGLWRWHTQEGRLKVVHGDGFPVLDVLRTDEDVEDQVERETREYTATTPFMLKRGPVAAHGEHDGPLEIWLCRHVPYVQARLMRALGYSIEERLSLVLFRHRARVRVTETHLDVHFALADLPIEIRIAGLDRDPGWVPAAGRYVKFHYE